MQNQNEVAKPLSEPLGSGIKVSFFAAIEKRMEEAGFSPEKVKQELSFALQCINKSHYLQKCTGESILTAVMNISNIGLSLNPAAKESYLVPRYNSTIKKMEASLDPSYVGLVKLLTDSGSVTSMVCQLVYTNDVFIIDLADNIKPVTHKIDHTKNRGDILGAYSLATLPNGNRQVEWMMKDEIDAIRERSESYKSFVAGTSKSCIWDSDYGEMARKTVIKRQYKYLPRTDRMNYVDQAIQADNSDYTASDDQIDYIVSLLQTSTLDQHQRDAIEMETGVMTRDKASAVIQNLKENQLDRISSGMSYNQNDITEHKNKMS